MYCNWDYFAVGQEYCRGRGVTGQPWVPEAMGLGSLQTQASGVAQNTS